MDGRRRKRQLVLFLAAILVPAILLIGLGIRVLRQEGELSDKRIADDRRTALEQLRNELSTKLEAIKLQELQRLQEDSRPSVTRRPADSPVVFILPLDQDRIVMPWAEKASNGRPSAEYTAHRKRGENAEFVANDWTAAVHAYEDAFHVARSPFEKCEARLWIARSLQKLERSGEAANWYHAMLTDCESVRDPDGVSYGLYAADRLISNQSDPATARQYVLRHSSQRRWWNPMEAYLMSSLVGDVPELSSTIHDMEQMIALAADQHSIGLFRFDFPFSERPGDSVWLGYGTEPWLVTVMSPATTVSPVVLAISSERVPLTGATLVPRTTKSGVLLGEGFVDVGVEWPPDRFASNSTAVSVRLYAVGLLLILGATVLAGYLLLRDVNREVQMADMRSHFVASVSHELKTPLTAIRMFAETLAMGRARNEETKTEYLHTIVNETERLSRLVDNVLDFSRIERGNKIYRMQPASLETVIASAARTMQYPLSQQGFHLKQTIEGPLPDVLLDADAMEQAILNLLTNAMKYSGDSRELELELKRVKDEAVITVTDHGIGIPESEHQRIFEKFYRVRSETTDLVAGTGLGLTLAQHIVKAHGGRMEVASELGKGSSFSVNIPMRSEAGC
jgi:signal transduction histidine kinase